MSHALDFSKSDQLWFDFDIVLVFIKCLRKDVNSKSVCSSLSGAVPWPPHSPHNHRSTYWTDSVENPSPSGNKNSRNYIQLKFMNFREFVLILWLLLLHVPQSPALPW